jgi:hypothetical protein
MFDSNLVQNDFLYEYGGSSSYFLAMKMHPWGLELLRKYKDTVQFIANTQQPNKLTQHPWAMVPL